MNQAQLADWVGIGRATLSRYERGDLTPPTDVLAELAKALQSFDVSVDWLLYGEIDEVDEKPPVRLKRFGSLVGLRFTRGGEAEVLMTTPEIERFLEACEKLESSRSKPNPKALDAINFLIEHFLECEESLSILADVPIAAHGAKIVPAFPEWDAQEDLTRWTAYGGMEKSISQTKSEHSASDTQNKIHQNIRGEGHQIAGGDIENNGGVTIGGRHKK
jgi:transcriptional regulator with XRE-family HTH domain